MSEFSNQKFNDKHFEKKCEELDLNDETLDCSLLNDCIKTSSNVIPYLCNILHFVINHIKSVGNHEQRRHLKFMVRMQEQDVPSANQRYDILSSLKSEPEMNYCLNMTSFLNLLNFISTLPEVCGKAGAACLLRKLEAYDIGIHQSQSIDYDPIHFMEVSRLMYNRNAGILDIISLYVIRMNDIYDGKFNQLLVYLVDFVKHKDHINIIVLELLRFVAIFHSDKEKIKSIIPSKKRKMNETYDNFSDGDNLILAQYSPKRSNSCDEKEEADLTTSSSSSSSSSSFDDASISPPE